MAKLSYKESSLNTTIDVSADGVKIGYIKQVSVRYHGRKWQWQPLSGQKGPYLATPEEVISSVTRQYA
jgi:hypothetical protein